MTTRLDRLFLLLDTGSTPVIRKSAAIQLGEVQKLHPHELHNLLTRVHGYLGSNTWETRIAAGHAVSALARNVPQWQPAASQCANKEEDGASLTVDMLRFENFDVSAVLQHGASLLGSEGAEYDVQEECGLADKDRLTRQKQLLNRKLGLDGAGGLGIEANALFIEEDLVIKPEPVEQAPPASKFVQQQLLLKLTGGSTSMDMSARERNKAKRKAKQLAKQSSKELTEASRNGDDSNGEPPASKLRRMSSVLVEQTDKDTVLVDNVPDNTLNMDNMCEWPFEPFSKLLMNDLFSSSWEKRHGAAMGLREIVKIHGTGAGKTADMAEQQMNIANQLWLEDLAIRIISVLALDRFGDFVSDEVVAPVREMCAQSLGVVVRHMSSEAVLNVWRPLYQLLTQCHWEVRHGGLLGLKYLLAVRQDLATELLVLVLPAILTGLQDDDDDVRAVAAASLLPVTAALVSTQPGQLGHIIACLWHTLLDLDDLTASTNSIMMLLSSLLAQPSINAQTESMQSLSQFVPRLWPFLMHNIASVRSASLETLHILLTRCQSQKSAEWVLPILTDLLRLVFQRSLLEDRPEILSIACKVWHSAIDVSSVPSLTAVTSAWLGVWLCLAMQPARLPFQPNYLLLVKHQPKELTRSRARHASLSDSSAPVVQQLFIGGSNCLSHSATQYDVSVVRARITAARLLGTLFCRLLQDPVDTSVDSASTEQTIDAIANVLLFHLNQKSAIQRYTVGLLLMECAASPNQCWPSSLVSRLHECLCEVVYFDEIAMPFTRLQSDCVEFATTLRNVVPSAGDIVPPGVLTLEQAEVLCTTTYEGLRKHIPSAQRTSFDTKRQQLSSLVIQTSCEQNTLHNRVQACLAGVLVRMQSLPEKLNPVVRPLMDMLKKEMNTQLQMCAADNLSRMVTLCQQRSPCPNPKIIKNLNTMLCCDSENTPQVELNKSDNSSAPEMTCDTHLGILSLNAQTKLPEVHRGRKPTLSKRSVSVDISLDTVMAEEDENRKAILVQRRGAEFALTTIAKNGGATLPELVPSLWQAMIRPIENSNNHTENSEICSIQELVNSLQILEVTGPALHPDLHCQLLSRVQLLSECLKHSYTAVRHMAARVLGMLSKLCLTETMNHVLETIVPMLSASHDVVQRQGAIEALSHIVQQLGVELVPYIVLVIVPVLGCITDQDCAVRLMSVSCFATLIRLMPLEAGIPDPPAMKGSLVMQKQVDRRFLEQLLDGSKLENFVVPVPINAKLRKYQQDGVNWMAFLNKFKLHGILCDDMGLGKTLQSICILAADHYNRCKQNDKTGQPDCEPLPSIVICPPTLTGHWIYELEKFVSSDYLYPLHYMGPPKERHRLQKEVKHHNLVVASYDVVRNDIDFFSTISWNYCILDEGHIIKNSKTKLFRAIKQLQCAHRLILSGTPIQNNVLELWSLFDFLLPGLLGSEKQFQARYGRPILQSRDAKSSSHEQEAGALAMEALHRQVLPFLLRRLKEDVLQDLPPKIIQDYYCDLSPLQMKLYEDFAKTRAKKTVEEELQETGAGGDRPLPVKTPGSTHIFQALQYLRKVCNHPALAIHTAHPDYEQLRNELNAQGSHLRDSQHAPKLGALKQLMLDCGIGIDTDDTEVAPVVSQHRALVFCQLKGMLDIVEQDLLKAEMPKVSYLRLDGSVAASNRHSIVKRFNNDPSIDVLLLTTHVGGLGLNLTGADTVIFVEHDWNPMKDLQAMDRAHRIGQKKVVNVYRLISRGTLEEKIMGLQKFKLNIANSVISQENSSLASMATDQVLDLFSLGPAAPASKETTARQNTQSILEGLDELWDEKQYETEHDVDSFLQTLTQ